MPGREQLARCNSSVRVRASHTQPVTREAGTVETGHRLLIGLRLLPPSHGLPKVGSGLPVSVNRLGGGGLGSMAGSVFDRSPATIKMFHLYVT